VQIASIPCANVSCPRTSFRSNPSIYNGGSESTDAAEAKIPKEDSKTSQLMFGMKCPRNGAYASDVLSSSVLPIQLCVFAWVQLFTLQTRVVWPVSVGAKNREWSIGHTSGHCPACHRVDVFPNDFLVRGYLEYPAWCTFADQSVAIR
jgi:hypothetical protein